MYVARIEVVKSLAPMLALAACVRGRAPTEEELGRRVFFDGNLSRPAGQSCADCHAPASAFRDPEGDRTTSMGAIQGRFGPRNTPTALYARFIPPLHFDRGRWIGGLFWDGRASTLEDQAGGPLLNPLEMNNPDKAAVVDTIRHASYAPAFRELFGPRALDDVDAAFARVTEVLAAYERTPELAPFSSKYDRYVAGDAVLSAAEARGLAIFEDPARGNCVRCHPPPLFTDYSYANLGVPHYGNSMYLRMPAELNPDGERFVDHGLATTVHDPAQDGKFRVPTLRNIARTAPYGHNGYFENVPYMLDFLNTRDIGSFEVGSTCDRARGVAARCPWPEPEVAANVDRGVGALGLGDDDLADLYAFLQTLTDERP